MYPLQKNNPHSNKERITNCIQKHKHDCFKFIKYSLWTYEEPLITFKMKINHKLHTDHKRQCWWRRKSISSAEACGEEDAEATDEVDGSRPSYTIWAAQRPFCTRFENGSRLDEIHFLKYCKKTFSLFHLFGFFLFFFI